MMAAERLSTSWRLAGLLDGMVAVPDVLDVPVTGLSADSRVLEAGQIFLARRGASTDGARFLDAAVLMLRNIDNHLHPHYRRNCRDCNRGFFCPGDHTLWRSARGTPPVEVRQANSRCR